MMLFVNKTKLMRNPLSHTLHIIMAMQFLMILEISDKQNQYKKILVSHAVVWRVKHLIKYAAVKPAFKTFSFWMSPKEMSKKNNCQILFFLNIDSTQITKLFLTLLSHPQNLFQNKNPCKQPGNKSEFCHQFLFKFPFFSLPKYVNFLLINISGFCFIIHWINPILYWKAYTFHS